MIIGEKWILGWDRFLKISTLKLFYNKTYKNLILSKAYATNLEFKKIYEMFIHKISVYIRSRRSKYNPFLLCALSSSVSKTADELDEYRHVYLSSVYIHMLFKRNIFGKWKVYIILKHDICIYFFGSLIYYLKCNLGNFDVAVFVVFVIMFLLFYEH